MWMLPTGTFWKRFMVVVVMILRFAHSARDISKAQWEWQSFIHNTTQHNQGKWENKISNLQQRRSKSNQYKDAPEKDEVRFE
jgi:hypothetical protein